MNDLEAILRKSPLTDKQRADLWDAYEGAADEDALASALESSDIPKQVKASLWDLKASSAPAAPDRNRGDVPTTPSMQPGAGEDQRSTAGHLLDDAGAAIVGGAKMAGSVVKGAAQMAGYGVRAAAAPLTVPLGVDTVGALIEDNPGINMVKAQAADINERRARADVAEKMGDTPEAAYQRMQAALSVVPGYGMVSRQGERAVGAADGQDLIDADPAAAGELAAQALLTKAPPGAGRAGTAVARGAATTARDLSRWIGRSAYKPLVSQMKKIAGSSAAGVEATAAEMVDFLIENRLSTPEQATKIIQQTGQQVDRLLTLKNAPTDAATRSARYLEELRANVAKAATSEKEVALINRKMRELVRGSMGEDVVSTVSKPGTILDSTGKPVMTQVEETVRKLRAEIPAKEAMESARSSSRNQTRQQWGEQKGIETEAQKQIERAQRDAVKEAVPEVAPLLKRQGMAIQSKEALDRMAFREANREPAGLGAQVAMAAGSAAGAGGQATVMAMALEVIRSGKLRGSFALDRMSKTLQNAVATNNPRQAALVLSKLGVTVAPRDLRPAAAVPFRPRHAAENEEPARGQRVATR